MKNRKYYLKNLLEEELKKKQEGDDTESEKKKCEDGDGLEDSEKEPVKKEEPSDNKDDSEKSEPPSDDKKADECNKTPKNEGKMKKEDDEPCDDDSDKEEPDSDDDIELESKKKSLKNEAATQIKKMIESGATPEQIAEELISVARESVMEMVEEKTKVLESEIETHFAKITEKIISENESQMIRVSSEVVTEKLKSLKEKQAKIVSENESYKATIEKMLAEAKEQDDLVKSIMESLEAATVRGNVFENAMYFNESTSGMPASEVDRISEIIKEEHLKLSHDEYKKVFESALSEAKVQAKPTAQPVVNESEEPVVNEEDKKFKQVMDLACAVASVSKWH